MNSGILLNKIRITVNEFKDTGSRLPFSKRATSTQILERGSGKILTILVIIF